MVRMKRNYLVILLIIMVIALFLSGCTALFREPTVQVGTIDLVDINATDLNLNVTLDIENPNPFGVMFQEITADVYYLHDDEWQILSHIEKKGIDIKSGGNTVILPVSAKNIDLIKAGFRFITSGEITVKVEGIAEPSFFGISPKIPFNQTKKIQLPGK